jgi:ornithine cyclodeaminase/alanine dehydrogenase-like protein (mu-crystallin family)
MLNVRRPTHLIVYGRDRNRAAAFARWAGAQHSWHVTVAHSVERAVRHAELVVTATTSTRPVVYGDWLAPGTHITAIGADNTTKRELDLSVLHRAQRIAVDDVHQARTLGELRGLDDATAANLPVTTLAAVLTGDATGRTHPDDITIADLTGLGIQDAAVAQHLATLFPPGDTQ